MKNTPKTHSKIRIPLESPALRDAPKSACKWYGSMLYRDGYGVGLTKKLSYLPKRTKKYSKKYLQDNHLVYFHIFDVSCGSLRYQVEAYFINPNPEVPWVPSDELIEKARQLIYGARKKDTLHRFRYECRTVSVTRRAFQILKRERRRAAYRIKMVMRMAMRLGNAPKFHTTARKLSEAIGCCRNYLFKLFQRGYFNISRVYKRTIFGYSCTGILFRIWRPEAEHSDFIDRIYGRGQWCCGRRRPEDACKKRKGKSHSPSKLFHDS